MIRSLLGYGSPADDTRRTLWENSIPQVSPLGVELGRTGIGAPVPGATVNVNKGKTAYAPGAPNNVGTVPPIEPSVAFRNALLAGGQAAARAPAYDSVGSSLASALASGLTSGAQSFVATRDAEKDRNYQMQALAQQRAFEQQQQAAINSGLTSYANARPDQTVDLGNIPGTFGMGGKVDVQGEDPLAAGVRGAGQFGGDFVAKYASTINADRKARADAVAAAKKSADDAKAAKLLADAALGNPTTAKSKDRAYREYMAAHPGISYDEAMIAVDGGIAQAGAARTSFNTYTQDPTAKALEAGTIDDLKTQKPLMQKAAASLTGLDKASELLASGKVNTGVFSAAKQLWARLRNDPSAEITQEYINTVINGVLPQLKPMLGGNFSRAEFEVFIKSGGGSASDQLAAMQNIIAARKAAVINDLDTYDALVESFAEKYPQQVKSYRIRRPSGNAPSAAPLDFTKWKAQGGAK